MAKKLKYPVAVWYNSEEGQYYGFPLGAKDPWGGDVVPKIDWQTWEFKGVIPAGLPVDDVKPDHDHRVKVSVSNIRFVTGDWALVDD